MTDEELRAAAKIAELNSDWEKADESHRESLTRRLLKLQENILQKKAMPADPAANYDMQPLVSIVVAARNYGRFLADCLHSCTRQNYPNVEVIYADDASQDDSVCIAAQFANVKTIASKLHSGAVEARNRGYRLSRGEVLIFVDGDDMLPDDFVASRVTALQSGETSFAYGGYQAFGRSNARIAAPEWTGREALWQNNFCDTSSAIWRRVFEEAGGWREAPGNCWDWDLWLRASQIARPVKCDSYLLYRLHGENNSVTVGHAAPGRNWDDMRWEIRQQALGKPAPVRRRPLRIGFVHPTIALGGAERWLLSMIRSRALNNDRIACAGIALTENRQPDRARVEEAAAATMLVGPPQLDGAVLTEYRSTAEAVRALAAESDVLIWWCALPIRKTLDDYTGAVVHVSHGALVWAGELDEAGSSEATHRVAVSRVSAARFGSLPYTVIHNGVDVDRCLPQRPRAQVRRELGLKRHEIAVGYIGRFSWEKNPLAPALAVAELGRPYRSVMMGGGWQEQEVRRAATEISKATIFVDDNSFVGDVLSALDCVVLASKSEGFSLGLTEAWMAGRPTVATRVGAIPELERSFGRLTTPVEIDPSGKSLAAAVRKSLRATNRKIVEHAQEVARSHFTAEAMAERWAEYLIGICRPQ